MSVAVLALLGLAAALAVLVVATVKAGQRLIAERVATLITDAHQVDCAGCCAVCQAPRHDASCVAES